jgi:hypothetical protein
VRKPLEEIEQAAISGERVNRKLAALAVQDPPRPEPFSLTGLLRRTRKMLESIVGDGVALSVQADPNTRKLWADPAQMERVLLNLVIHAGASLQKKPAEAQKLLVIEVGNAEHSSSNGTLPFVRLTVTYSASEPDGDAIFDPSPLEEDRTALFIAHKIVSEHGGYLAVSATGEYSCFEILLPGQETVASQAATPCEGAIPTVLLVEPLDSLRRELHNYFEAHGIRLLEAANESEAIALAQIHEEPIQVAIVENGGAEILTPALKDLHPDLKLLEITTGDIEPNRHSDASIARPFTEKGLLECVRAMLSHVPQAAAAG